MRTWIVALAGLLLLPIAAQADNNVINHGSYNASAATGAKTDANGNALQADADRDRDYSLITTLYQSVVLNAGATFQPNTPIYIGQYSRPVLMLAYGAAAADSDSVRIAVRIWAKKSPSSGNLYLWTPQSGLINPADTCWASGGVDADSTGTGRCMTPVSFVISRRYGTPPAGPQPQNAFMIPITMTGMYEGPAFGTPGTKRVRIRKIPGYAWRAGGNNAVYINLSDNAGNPIPFPYIFVEVDNLSPGANLTSVTAEIWPRVF